LKKRRLVLPVAVLYTAVAAVAFAFCLLALAASFYYRPTAERTGSGGIGAVAAGLGDPIVVATLLFVIAGVTVNVSIAQEIRGRLAITARRAHLALMLATLVWPLPFGFLLIYLSERDTDYVMAVGAACAALFCAAHMVFGIFATRVLRRG
jgi:hypothetical protein